MKFKIDENLPVEAAATFCDAGFDAETIGEERLSGADDQIVAARVRWEGRILVTLDLDFANIQAYPPEQFAGIIVLRLEGAGQADRARAYSQSNCRSTTTKPSWRVVDCPA